MRIAAAALLLCAAPLNAKVSIKEIQTVLRLRVAGDSARPLVEKLRASRQSPIVEGRNVAFVYEAGPGERPVLGGALTAGRGLAMQRLGSSNVFALVIEVDDRQKTTYSVYIGDEPRPDPWNPARTEDARSIVQMPKYRPPAELSSGPLRGRIEPFRVASKVLGRDCEGLLYVPEDSQPSRGMILLGGPVYRAGGAVEILDALIARKRVPPVAAVLIDPFDRAEAYLDGSDRLARFLRDDLVPALQALHPIREVGLAGTAEAGWAAFHAAWAMPEAFPRVLTQSAAFQGAGRANPYPGIIRAAPLKHLIGWMSVSAHDRESDAGSFADGNHLVWGALRQRGYAFTFHDDDGYHDGFTWQRQLPEAFVRLWSGAVQ
ncbi:MAG: hypothetical protein IPM24_01435 [Bryobacterales bacterium]|nr:hypothetical protein [Bryobacterales bacterium]